MIPAGAADLPVVDVLDALAVALAPDGATAVLVAPPGAGKTTLVPLWLADQPWLAGRKIVVLEPRRLATRAAAQRMASLLGEPVGATVGYQTRDERRIGPATRIEVVTEGVLTRRLQHDPELPGVGIVLFDEVHERNLPTDVGLAFALDSRRHLRPDLRLLAMSATADTAKLPRLLGGDTPAAVVASDGRMHPVDLQWLPATPNARRGGRPARPRIEEPVADAVRRALTDESGDVLVFLPGIGEIRRVETLLRGTIPANVDVRALAGALATADQDLALQRSPAGRRRVVLSTDIAESSLTVDGVRVVVDAGLARVPRFDARTGMTRLTTVAASRASTDQRAGRAGRVEPGVCYRLWSKLEHSTRLAHLPAEITQVDLAGLALDLAEWGTAVEDLDWCDQPPAKALQQARELLASLDALDLDGDAPRVTPLGRRLLDLPVHPRLGRMIVAAAAPDQPLACVAAALIDERDVLRGRPDELPVDLAWRVRVVCGDERDDRADRRVIDRLRDRALDLARRAGVTLRLGDVDARHCGAVLALGFPDRLAIRRRQPGQFQLRNGGGAWMATTDELAGEAFVVAADLDGDRAQARIRLAAGLAAADVEASMGHLVERRTTLSWDTGRDDLVERTEVRLGAMLISESARSPAAGPATAAALVDRVRSTRLAVLDVDRAAQLRARVAALRALDGEVWPDWSDRALSATLDDWLAPYLTHATGRGDLVRLDVGMLLANQLDWDRQVDLADQAPPTLTTASGRTATIDWTRDHPTASVRVQDLFGTASHPTVARGRIPLTLELLSPADRPLQITTDLPGFWRGTWADVRKEMAGRYPKHQWPVDPATAPPSRLKRDT